MKICKECVDKKHNIGATIDLGVEDFSDASNNNTAIAYERCDVFQYNSDEGSTTIDNEICDVLHNNYYERSITIANERCDILQNKYDEGNTSITKKN